MPSRMIRTAAPAGAIVRKRTPDIESLVRWGLACADISVVTENELIEEFFAIFPDYELCRTSAHNVAAGITSREKVLELLWKKVEGSELNRGAIDERLDSKKIRVGGSLKTLKNLSLREVIRLPDEAFEEALRFYFKHPYAHSRVSRNRILPRFVRTFFFRQLIGQAMIRKLDVDVPAMFEMMKML